MHLRLSQMSLIKVEREMATNQFVPKSELFAQLRNIFTNKESGMLTLLTDSKTSVLMRFSSGELTSARCRNWDIENTISALLETETVKYSYIPREGEDKEQLVAASDFMMMIDPGGSGLESEQVLSVKDESQQKLKTESAEASEKEVEQAGKHVDRAIAAKMNYF